MMIKAPFFYLLLPSMVNGLLVECISIAIEKICQVKAYNNNNTSFFTFGHLLVLFKKKVFSKESEKNNL